MLFLPVYIFRKAWKAGKFLTLKLNMMLIFDENWNLWKTGKASKFSATYLLGGLRFEAFC